MRSVLIVVGVLVVIGLVLPVIMAQARTAQTAKLPIKPPKYGGVYTVAHRGAHQGIPENTIPAYTKAIELGIDFVEVDARTTKDGKIVSVHNEDLSSYTQGTVKAKVRELTLAEIKTVDVGSRVGPQWKDARVPTLEEVMDACKGKVGIYLDFKDASVGQVVDIIKARGMEHDVIWYATPPEIAELRTLCPECVEMPDPSVMENLKPLLAQVKPRIVATDGGVMNEDFIKTCHAAGAIVICDEANINKDPTWWDKAIAWGVDGIQTDSPEKLISYLKQRK